MDPQQNNPDTPDPYAINTGVGQQPSNQEPNPLTRAADAWNAPSLDPQTPAVIPTTQTETLVPPPPIKSGMRLRTKIIAIVLILLALLLVLSLSGLYALAYHKVELSQYPEVQKKIEFFVMELPYTPKSVRYLLYKSATAEKNYSSQSFDISAAIETNSPTPQIVGLSNFDFEAKGDVDIKDPKNPLMNMNLSITKDFNLDLKVKDKFLYFKINKLPQGLLALFGLATELTDPLTNIWVSYDTTPLQTDARKLLDEKQDESQVFNTDVSKEIEKYIDKGIMEKIDVSKGDDDGVPVYKMHLDATPEMIDKLDEKLKEKSKETQTNDLYIQDTNTTPRKLSDGLKNLTFDMWVDQTNYYTRRISISFKVTPDSTISENLKESNVLGLQTSPLAGLSSEANVAMVMKFSEFGKTVAVDIPADVLTFEEYSGKLSELMRSLYTAPPDTGLVKPE